MSTQPKATARRTTDLPQFTGGGHGAPELLPACLVRARPDSRPLE
jgi:hypothetical protein